MNSVFSRVFVAMLGVLALATTSMAGGLYLYEVGGAEVGLASAGYAARAQDATTVFTNPAGMTRLEQREVHLGLQPMYLSLDFEPGKATTAPGSDGSASSWMPAGSVFYVQPLGEKWSVGFGVAGFFGLALDYDDDWVGRYYANEATLQGLSLLPTLAYKANDWLSVGGGLNIMYGMFETSLAIKDFGLVDNPDGKLELEDSVWGLGGNFGLLIEPNEKTRFGLTYLTPTELDFEDTPKITGDELFGPLQSALMDQIRSGSLDLGLTAPQAVMLSGYHEVTENLALLANLGWQDWSRFGKVEISIIGQLVDSDITTELDYKDTWHAALGIQYRVAEPWLLSCGIAYDSAMIDDDQRSPALPVGESWRFGLGVQHGWSEDLVLGGGYELAWGGDLPMEVQRGALPTIEGDYTDSALHVFSLYVDWKF